jgi:hypothetical protein
LAREVAGDELDPVGWCVGRDGHSRDHSTGVLRAQNMGVNGLHRPATFIACSLVWQMQTVTPLTITAHAKVVCLMVVMFGSGALLMTEL